MDLRLTSLVTAVFAILNGGASLGLLAANKNGVSPTAISLPGGPGSLEGLGEAFQPNINNGTGKDEVELKLPGGTAGHSPELSLVYEGGDGNGILGFGWSLPVAYVQRQTDKGVPRYDESDGFINELREELVPVAVGADRKYFCENEGAFIRYQRVGEHWEGRLPNGSRLIFGESPSARIVDSDASENVFRWMLERHIDTNGNEIRYRYAAHEGEADLAQKYLSAVSYGPGSHPWGGFFHSVVLEYEERIDWFEDCRPGFPLRTGRRLARVVSCTQGIEIGAHLKGDFNHDAVADNLNRVYRIDYHLNAPVSLVASITEVGADGQTALPAKSYGYTVCRESDSIDVSGHIAYSVNEPGRVFDSDSIDFVDMNGDALPDLLETSGGHHRIAINSGEGETEEGDRVIRWSPYQEVSRKGESNPWQFGLMSESVLLSDMDGDGLSDLVQMTPENVYYFSNEPLGDGNVAWGPRKRLNVGGMPNPPSPFASGSRARSMDLNFDKRIDIIRSSLGGDRYQVWFNDGEGGFRAPANRGGDDGYDLALAAVKSADLNGDRLVDLAWIRPLEVEFSPSLGHGNFGSRVAIRIPNPDGPLTTDEIAKASLRDVNGDGTADLVLDRPVPREIWFWPNRGNYTFGNRIRFTGIPRTFSERGAVRWVDINGNGTTDIVVGDGDAVDGERISSIDVGRLMGCVPRPYLMNRADNGIGRVEEIEYTTSTEFVLEDGTDETGAYSYAWPHPLPFPVTVIREIRTMDSLGDTYVSRFKYHDGYYDADEKQFRGFGRVERFDVGDDTAPTQVSRSYFDVGLENEVLKGKLLRLTTEDESGLSFSNELHEWTFNEVYEGSDGRVVRFAHPTSVQTEVTEQGRGKPQLTRVEYEYDRFGNQTLVRNFGLVESDAPGASLDQRIMETQFAYNLDDWLVRYPILTEVKDSEGQVINRTRTFYDDETFSGDGFGAVSIGNVTLVQDWFDLSQDESGLIRSKRTVYDDYGNPIKEFDPLYETIGSGHWRKIVYDPWFHTYPIGEEIYIDGRVDKLDTWAEYDLGFGTIVRATDFNGNVTRFRYDALSRLSRIIKPYDSEEAPTAEFEYALAVPFEADSLINYIEVRMREQAGGEQFVSREFFDGLGRERLEKREDEEPGRYVVSEVQTYNDRRGIQQILNPYYSAHFDYERPITEIPRISNYYDALGRPVLVENQDGSIATRVYEPFVIRSLDENDNDETEGAPHAETPMVHYRDGLDRLVRVDEVVKLTDEGRTRDETDIWSTHYQYRTDDKLLLITDSQGNEKSFQYDNLGRVTELDDPNRGRMAYFYDAASNLLRSADQKGQVISHTYDGANRMLTEDYWDEGTDGSFGFRFDPQAPMSAENRPDVAYFYDRAQPQLDFGDGTEGEAGNTEGRLAFVWDLSGEEHTSYDKRGRVEWEVKRVPDELLTDILVSYKTSYAYDSLDRLTRLGYPDGDFAAYDYNDRSLLERVLGGPSGAIVRRIDYTPWDKMELCELGNGVTTTRSYDNRLRLSTLTTTNADGVRHIDYGYQFDPVSNLSRIHDRRGALVGPEAGARRNTQEFTYDNLYRLTGVRYPAAGELPSREITYRYDQIGNLLEKQSDIEHQENDLPLANVGRLSYGGMVPSPGGDEIRAGPHAVTAIEGPLSSRLGYDQNGNVTEIDGVQSHWDFKDRMVSVTRGAQRGQYIYDHNDRRVIRRVFSGGDAGGEPPEVETFFYINQYFEMRPGERPIKYVWNGGYRVARITGTIGSDRDRVQRLRLRKGWNLAGVGVEGAQNQLTPEAKQQIEASLAWNRESRSWVKIAEDLLPANTPVWLRVDGESVVGLTGRRAETEDFSLDEDSAEYFANTTGRDFPISELPEGVILWHHDTEAGEWRTTLFEELFGRESEVPPRLEDGQSVLLRTEEGVVIPLRVDLALAVRYYHEDHLGSTNAVTDANGELVEELAYYPFGQTRFSHRPRQLVEAYGFSGKEKDAESGLHYFERRFLVSRLGRFNRVDPMAESVPGYALGQPQLLNPYSYAANNPLVFVDPTGLWPKWGEVLDGVQTGLDVVGMIPGVGEIADGANALISLGRGDYAGAALSVAAMVPGAGAGATAAKWARKAKKTSKVVGEVKEKQRLIESVTKTTRKISGGCFLTGTVVATASGEVPIEEVRVGDRVLTSGENQPGLEISSDNAHEWRKVRYIMAASIAPHQYVAIESLERVEFLESSNCRVGSTVVLSLDEIGVSGPALVSHVERCPDVEPGGGRVVLSTFTHINPRLLSIRFVRHDLPVFLTATHHVYSADHESWIPAIDVGGGHSLRSFLGSVTVDAVATIAGSFQVYNLEVDSEHSYYSGSPRILVHNAGKCPPPNKTLNPSQAARASSGGLPASNGIKTSTGLEIKGFTAHGVDRAIGDAAGRAGVKPQSILDALKNPLKVGPVKTDQLGRQSQRFIGQTGEVVVNPQTGKIISVNPTSTKKAERLLRQQQGQ